MRLSQPTLKKLIDQAGSDFSAAIIAAKRARKLNSEAGEELLDEYEGNRLVTQAFEEIAAGEAQPKERNE